MSKLRVAVIGCGLIGSRRAREVARHPLTQLAVVAEVNAERRQQMAASFSCQTVEHWKAAVEDQHVDLVVVSTPNGYSAEIAIAALSAGKHVLVEKPPGKNLAEARQLAEASRKAQRILKVGFNHRYHPAIKRAHELCSGGTIGRMINIRARYGHGGRPGYEKEWRGDPELAGGGELTDQGVHIADLLHWFAGLPAEAFAILQTAVWPIQPLEDNAFGLFRYASGVVASLHTSWTQWKNLFSLELFGEQGSLSIEGLGGSYGPERLTTVIRNPSGGIPSVQEELFEGPDISWQREWEEFVGAVTEGSPYLGTPADGIAAMTMIDALYRSARSGTAVGLQTV
ncbi:Gfo/Idh/MocA family protein [Nitrospira sp. Kam-Ns4a]